MNVGIYLPEIKPESGGGYTFIHTILDSLFYHKSRHKFFVFFEGEMIKEKNSAIKYVALPKNKVPVFSRFLNYFNKKIFSFRHPINRFIKKYKIEIIWFPTPHFQKVNAPFIITVWDLQHRLQPFFPEVSLSGFTWEERERYYSSILPRATYVLTGTEAGSQEIMQFYGIPRDRIRLLLHPTPIFALNPSVINIDQSFKDKIPKNFLFYPAQFWPHKNHVGILYSLKIITEKYNLKLSVVFTGSDMGNLSFVKEKVRELHLEDKVYFLGFVSQTELIYLYKKAFALLYPTFFGPENLPPLEAFALGCPVIASNVAGIKEQLRDAAILVNPADEKEIAEAVNKLWYNNKLRARLIQKGILRAKKWTSNDYIKGICNILDEFEPYRRCWSSKVAYRHLPIS